MLGLRWHDRGDIRLDEIEEPEVAPGFPVVEVDFCGICGTDLEEFRAGPILISRERHPLTGQVPPLTLGHEFSGRIVVSDGAFALGMRVTADACWRCGACEMCRAGDYHLCRYGGSIGLHSDGAFARLVRVPEYALVPLPDGVSAEQGALTEPFAVALHALTRGGLGGGETVLVLGFGPIGAAGALVARALGAVVVVVDAAGARRGAAESLRFRTLAAGDDLPRRLRRTLGTGGADVVLDATGAAGVLPLAVECARRTGRIVVAGLSKQPSSLETARLTLFERSLVGSLGYRNDLPRVLAMVDEGLLNPAVIVADVVPLERAPETFERLAIAPSAHLKVLVRPAD